jgi:hypothetical protein
MLTKQRWRRCAQSKRDKQARRFDVEGRRAKAKGANTEIYITTIGQPPSECKTAVEATKTLCTNVSTSVDQPLSNTLRSTDHRDNKLACSLDQRIVPMHAALQTDLYRFTHKTLSLSLRVPSIGIAHSDGTIHSLNEHARVHLR